MANEEGEESGSAPGDPLYNPLLTKVFGGNKEALENEIAAKMEGANKSLNRTSAMRKIVREKGRRELEGTVTRSGYYLQNYPRKPTESNDTPGISVYLATKQGIATIHADSKEALPNPKASGLTGKIFGEKQKWSGLTEVENIIYGTKSLRSGKGKVTLAPATHADIGQKLWEMSHDITTIKDGQDIWRGYVAAIFPVGIFENGKAVGNHPILGSGGEAALRVGLTDSIDRKTGRPEGRAKTFVQITSEGQLKTLLGEYFEESFLLQDNAAKELADSLLGQPVVVFGSGTTPQSDRLTKTQRERMREPKIGVWGGRGVIAPWIPDAE